MGSSLMDRNQRRKVTARTQVAIKETVQSMNRLGYLDLIVITENAPAMSAFRDVVFRKFMEHFGVRAIAQAPPQYDSLWDGGERHQTRRRCELW